MKLVGNSKAIRSPEFHKKKEREKVLKISLLSLLLLIILSTPFFILRLDRLQIEEVEIYGNFVTGEEEVKQIIMDELSGNTALFIPKSSSLLLRRGKLERLLLEKIPRLSQVEVSLFNSKTLEVDLVEREPFALYCEDVSDFEEPSGCFFLDETGYIFSEAPVFSGDVYMLYTIEPKLEMPLGSRLISSEEFEEIKTFVSDLPRLGLDPKALSLKDDEYALVLSSGTEMRWKLKQDILSLASDLEVFLNSPEIKKITFGDLLYIDLRIDNKVFYKFRNE